MITAKQTMVTISKLVVSRQERSLKIITNEQLTYTLPFEFLRIFAAPVNTKQVPTDVPQIYHKKNVLVNSIEPLGKHGHRLIFNDGEQSIYHNDYLFELAENQSSLWQDYLKHLDSTQQNREESIMFKEVK